MYFRLFLWPSWEEQGVWIFVQLGDTLLCLWISVGPPVWWKPKLIRVPKYAWGFGAGWLIACFRFLCFRNRSWLEFAEVILADEAKNPDLPDTHGTSAN